MIFKTRRMLFWCQPSLIADQRRMSRSDDFWLLQPKIINLIAFKMLEQLYGFN